MRDPETKQMLCVNCSAVYLADASGAVRRLTAPPPPPPHSPPMSPRRYAAVGNNSGSTPASPVNGSASPRSQKRRADDLSDGGADADVDGSFDARLGPFARAAAPDANGSAYASGEVKISRPAAAAVAPAASVAAAPMAPTAPAALSDSNRVSMSLNSCIRPKSRAQLCC